MFSFFILKNLQRLFFLLIMLMAQSFLLVINFHLLFAYENTILIPTLMFLSKSWKLNWKNCMFFIWSRYWLQETKTNRPWSRLFKFWRSSSVISLASFWRKVFSWKSCGIGIPRDCHPKVVEDSRPATGKQWRDLSILI